MDLESAIGRIRRSFDKMNAAYGRPVFDEVAIVGLEGEEPRLRYYDGPREAGFLEGFADDSRSLRRELASEGKGLGGEFDFTREGEGRGIDAYICLGPGVYLFCNNTEKSMAEVTADPNWLDAQGEFLNASQYFAVDPLVADPAG